MTRRSSSFRFTEDEWELIDAVRDQLAARRYTRSSRADVLRLALQRLKPPDDQTPEASRWRRAYSAVFPHAGGER